MKRYLLDTNIISELRKPRPHGAVLAWIDKQEAEKLFLSAFTLGELQAGVEKTRRQDPSKADELESWINNVAFSAQVLPMDIACFREWGRIMDRKSTQLVGDAMIAATARVYQLIIVTRNENDFRQFRVEIINPFRGS